MRIHHFSVLAVGLVSLCLFNTGCASRQAMNGSENEPSVQISGSEEASKEVMANLDKPYQSPLGEIPLDITPLTEQWIKYFQGRGRRYMEVYLERSTRYLPMMKNTLRENGLPEDLVYVSLIESGFSPLAHSHANAVGYWQFIRATGKRYGLMVDPFIDERRDPVLSTRAAAEYFKALYNLFGSWHLSLSAYNVGENRVQRAVRKYASRDFWQLIKNRRAFPKETKHYVPKFIAAALIAKDPAKYGFDRKTFQAPLAFDTVALVNPVSMTKLAAAMNLDVEELKQLNPKFRGDYVPMYRGADTVIRVPVGASAAAVAAIPTAFSAQPKVLQADFYFYRVRSGDSLSTIARKHKTSIATIRRLNNIGNRTLLRVGQKLRVPDRGGSFVSYEMPTEQTTAAVAANSGGSLPTTKEAEKSGDSSGSTEDSASNFNQTEEMPQPGAEDPAPVKTTHVVRRGENLTLIAKKYGVTIAELRRLNKLSQRSVLKVGQTLRLKEEEISPSAKSGAFQNSGRSKKAKTAKAGRMIAEVKAKPSKSTKAQKRESAKRESTAKRETAKKREVASRSKHVVRKGETLADIAERYKVTIGAIVKKNQIKNRSRVLAGSELVIPRQ